MGSAAECPNDNCHGWSGNSIVQFGCNPECGYNIVYTIPDNSNNVANDQDQQCGGGNGKAPNNASCNVPNNAPNNGTQQKQQTQPQHFWQKPGCGAALAEFGVGVAGTAITVGAVAAAIYLGPEMFEGIEGAATLLHIAPVGAPGLVMMGDGGFKATQTCF
jgi:hypothetical protein